MLFPQSFIRVWFFWESRLQHKCTWWLQVLWKFWNFELKSFYFFIWNFLKILKFYENWNFWKILKSWEILKSYENFFEILEILEIFIFFENFRVFVNRGWSPSVLNKYKTFIQSGRGTKNPRKRFTLPVHSLKNYGPLNSQTTGKREILM